MKKLYFPAGLIIFCIFFSPFHLSAQNHLIRGIVKDAETKQGIGFCSVTILHTSSGTTTDGRGSFKINVSENSTGEGVIVSNIGYTPDTVQVTVSEAVVVIYLKPMQSTLSNVVVTGVSRATLMKENPVAVQTVSSRLIERSSESNIIDVLVKNVPGLNAVKTGPNISKPFIRGLGYNRVLTLYDGIRQEGQQWGDEHGVEVDAYNIDKAEIIKGPASIMYGSDALAGVVSMMPAGNTGEKGKLNGRFVSEYQTNNGLIGNGIRLAYSNSHWTYIARGSYRMAKNYTNRIDGRVYNTGFREANASVTVRHDHSKGYSDINFTMYDNLQGIPDGSRDSTTRKFTKQVFEGDLDNIKTRPIVPDAALNSYRLSPLHQHIQHYRIYGSKHLETGKGDVDLLLAFQQNLRREYNHPTLPQQAGMYVRLNTLNYGIRYDAPAFLNTEISFGINGMYQRNKNKNATDFPIPDYSLLDAGTYVFAKWKKDRWTLSGGARFDLRYLQGSDFYIATDSSTGFTRKVTEPGIAGSVNQFPAFDKLFRGTSLSIGATYQVNGSITLKANIARGYRAPSITEFASNGLDPGAHIIYLGNRSFMPEFGFQTDIGAEIRKENYAFSASLFNNHVQQYIYLSQVTDASGNAVLDAQGNRTYQYQQASAQLYGLEAMFNLHPVAMKGFLFSNSFSAIRGYNRKPVYKGTGVQGAYLPLIPPTKLLSSISQDVQTGSHVFGNINGKIEVEHNAAQNRYLALDNTETATPAFTLFNLSLSTKLRYSAGSPLELQVQMNNIFDESYQSNLSRLKYQEYYAQSPGSPQGIYNMGRNLCFKVIVPF